MCNDCVICGGTITEFLNLGEQPLANSYKYHPEDPEVKYPLAIGYCKNCWHSQLLYYPDPTEMFSNYLYISGTSNTLVKFFEDLSRDFIPPNKKILEIAPNDGTLMSILQSKSKRVTGVDPARNLVEGCIKKNLEVLCNFWGEEEALNKVKALDVYDMAIAINVLAHVPDPVRFINHLTQVLDKEATILTQTSQYDMITNGEFDTVYHEHRSYFTASSMLELARRTGWNIPAMHRMNIHGCSLLSVWGLNESDAYNRYEEEESLGLHDASTYVKFGNKAKETVENLSSVIATARSKGRSVIGYGAAAKGNTLLNFGNITLDYIIDDNPMKCDLYTPGMSIPIKPTSILSNITGPTSVVVLAWNFLPEIKERVLSLVNTNDVEFITYFPEVTIQ